MSDSATPETPRRTSLGGQFGLMAIGALAIIGIGAVLIVGMFAASFLFDRAPREAPAKIEARGAASESFAVSDVDALRGTNLTEIVIATARSMGRDGGSYSKGEPADERNVILLDKASGASRKLLPDNRRQIIERIYLPAATGADAATSDGYEGAGAPDAKKPEPPFAYYLLRVRAAEGKEDVLVGNLATGRQAYLLTGLDGVDKVWMQSATRVALLMRQGRKLHYRAIEIPELKIVAARPVEID